ncbi:MAG: glycosyltransferase, partial [Thermoanaerobaculia bacterium]|nr:glycosyltransferase [Thermoanaerobaculia bacterium]
SSDLPVLREVLRHHENALLVEPGRPDARAEAIERLRDDSDLRRRLGETARRDLVAGHTWDRRAERVLAGLRP